MGSIPHPITSERLGIWLTNVLSIINKFWFNHQQCQNVSFIEIMLLALLQSTQLSIEYLRGAFL